MGKGNRNRTRNVIQNATDVELNQKNKAFEDFIGPNIVDNVFASTANYLKGLFGTNSTIDFDTNGEQEKYEKKLLRKKRNVEHKAPEMGAEVGTHEFPEAQKTMPKKIETLKEREEIRDERGKELVKTFLQGISGKYDDTISAVPGEIFYEDGKIFVKVDNRSNISEAQYSEIIKNDNGGRYQGKLKVKGAEYWVKGTEYWVYQMQLFNPKENKEIEISITGVGHIRIKLNDNITSITQAIKEKFSDTVSVNSIFQFQNVVLDDSYQGKLMWNINKLIQRHNTI